MNEPIVLAYSGSFASSVAIAWLKETSGAEVVTVTVDVGQSVNLDAVRGRAISAGALRAHVVDVRDAFARDHVLHALQHGGLDEDACSLIPDSAHPLIGRTLLEMAAIENATVVAHASTSATTRLDDVIARLDPAARLIAAAREWTAAGIDLVEYARARGIHGAAGGSDVTVEQNLWGRVVTWTDGPRAPSPSGVYRLTTDPHAAPDAEACVELAFGDGMPVAINGVTMPFTELIESLSTIAGRHGVGRVEQSRPRPDGGTWRQVCEAPAATVLRAAYAARRAGADVVRMRLFKGQPTVLASDRAAQLVNHP